jgi:hypothetical protein
MLRRRWFSAIIEGDVVPFPGNPKAPRKTPEKFPKIPSGTKKIPKTKIYKRPQSLIFQKVHKVKPSEPLQFDKKSGKFSPVDEAKDYEGMERHLRAAASKKGLSGKAFRAYVYGAKRRAGWKPNREEAMNEAIDVGKIILKGRKVAEKVIRKLDKPILKKKPLKEGGIFEAHTQGLRKPKTQRERRAAIAAQDQGVRVRGRRRGRSLPSDWDDLDRHMGKHGWKQQKGRKTQYRAEDAMTRADLIEAILEAKSVKRINLLRGPGASSTNDLTYTLSRRIHNQNTPREHQAVNPTFGLRQGLTTDPKIIRARMYKRLLDKVTRRGMSEAILEVAYPGDADIGRYIHMNHLDKNGNGYRHMSRAQYKAQRSMWRTQKNASVHLRDSGFDPARFAGKHNQELQISISHIKKNKIRGKDRMIKPTIPQEIW